MRYRSRAELAFRRNRARAWTGRALFAFGAVLFGYWTWVQVDARTYQASLDRRLEELTVPERSAPPPAPEPVRVASATRREAQASGLVGRLEIPRLKLSAMIIEGTDDRRLQRGVGHVENTAFPGEASNVGLAAHRDTYFHRLGNVAKGDRIHVLTPDGRFSYRVDSILVVDPSRGDLLDPTDASTLTLVTCFPFRWIGPAPLRFVVRARAEIAEEPAAPVSLEPPPVDEEAPRLGTPEDERPGVSRPPAPRRKATPTPEEIAARQRLLS